MPASAPRRALAGISLALGILVLGGAQLARADSLHAGAPSGLPLRSSSHFRLHYERDTGGHPVSDAQADQILGWLENAYATEVAPGPLNFPPPAANDDGSTQVDVYVSEAPPDSGGGEVTGSRISDHPAAATSSSWIAIDPAFLGAGTPGTLAHELFHVLQGTVVQDHGVSITEASADWAAARVTGAAPKRPMALSEPNASLDCGNGLCTADGTTSNAGYGHWPFVELISERYGAGIVREVYNANAAAGRGHLIDALEAVLTAHASSLSRAINDYAAAALGGSYTLPALVEASQSGPHPYAGIDSAALVSGKTQAVPVDHLASRYVILHKPCPDTKTPGTLVLTVALPPGSASRPVLGQSDSTAPQALTVSGDTASLELPFPSCGEQLTLALPNPSRTVDGAVFTVSGREIAAKPDPKRRVPTIVVRFPKRVVLGGRHPALSFAVRSSAAGRLKLAGVRTHLKKTFALRRGINRLRLALPRSIRPGVLALTLTPFSLSGQVGTSRGQVVRLVRPPAHRRR